MENKCKCDMCGESMPNTFCILLICKGCVKSGVTLAVDKFLRELEYESRL